jgi:sugar/nucleoside kinase (ribokinase family)
MTSVQAPRLVGIGAIFIDDIVLPSGQTHMGQLGGGVVHALMGASIWNERPGIVATVGQGLPTESAERLHRHLDTRGLVRLDIPQIRAWQLFEEDGTRRELYRVKETLPFIRGAQPEHFPADYAQSQGFYLLQGTEEIRRWRNALTGFVLWEPLQQIMTAENALSIRAVLRDCHIDVISPNLVEAQAIYGEHSPDDLVNAMLADGAQCVALRMGTLGSIVANQDGKRHHIGAVSGSSIVDQTGAGNTYCGGLLAGLIQKKSLQEAGVMAAVSASYCLEQVGVLDPTLVQAADRNRRYHQLLSATAIFH